MSTDATPGSGAAPDPGAGQPPEQFSQTNVWQVENYSPYEVILVFEPGTKNPNRYSVPPQTSPTAPGMVSPNQSVPWWYYNNPNFNNNCIEIQYQVSNNVHTVIGYIWQHGSSIYYYAGTSFPAPNYNQPASYTSGTELAKYVGAPLAFSTTYDASTDSWTVALILQ